MSDKSIILVCVTAQPTAYTIVSTAQKIAERQNAELLIFSVLPKRQSFAPDWHTLTKLQALSDQSNTQMRIVFADDPVLSMEPVFEEYTVLSLITGFPGKNSADFVRKSHLAHPQTPLIMVTTDGTAYSAAYTTKDAGNPLPVSAL